MPGRLSLLCLAFLATPALAGFYKSVDANGVVTYGNRQGAASAPAAPASAGASPTRFAEQRDALYGAMDVDPEQKRLNAGLPTQDAEPEPTGPGGVTLAMLLQRDLDQLLRESAPSPAEPPPGAEGSYRYPLPWVGGPFRVSQGANGGFSHHTVKSRYALDIAMPEGTPIVAARAGRVLTVRNDQAGREGDPSGNHVRVLHRDGSMSVYLHLQPGSVAVHEGQLVEVGTPLARSGNTGHSTGPHLHFVVQRNVGNRVESIPFEFAEPVGVLPSFALGKQ
ncbi:peptidoglycan DD-metalloendopeptidase family protein [Pseudomonas mangiferae]|uniref:M23 family metallopeptidase n=1 Tax=Pseudomonas mangiferae TaxID=2593654 RepID=A0A553GVA4_9PSED|nr:M23 family metallopeptidase [Pseudomonas mangiferae]TRX73421.1 M23 family metallopeptidase [Pseudomonas mangiferae]